MPDGLQPHGERWKCLSIQLGCPWTHAPPWPPSYRKAGSTSQHSEFGKRGASSENFNYTKLMFITFLHPPSIQGRKESWAGNIYFLNHHILITDFSQYLATQAIITLVHTVIDSALICRYKKKLPDFPGELYCLYHCHPLRNQVICDSRHFVTSTFS